MPCTYTGSLEGDRALAARESAEFYRKEIQKHKEELDKLTRMLCAVITFVGSHKTDNKSVEVILWESATQAGVPKDEISDWWEDHKKKDAEREEYQLYLKLKEKYD